MLVHKKKRVLVLKPRNPEHITATIPTAKAFQYKGATLVAGKPAELVRRVDVAR